ncbi:hypothetical protein OEA41_006333 [Lepraria neglecta]|uniref:Uncharacterized protein n=1 Tax=Lepraria neglecta TaxID=209136 RepID=A0AAE0DKU4_9LECA|nr:hypothetical protein OEA41_006333 [Lepraria neglecta]
MAIYPRGLAPPTSTVSWRTNETIVCLYFLSRGVSPRAVRYLIHCKFRTDLKVDYDIDRCVARAQRHYAEDGFPELIGPRSWDLNAMNNFLSYRQAGGRWSKVLSPNKVQYHGRRYCAPGKFEFDSQLAASLAETFLQKQGPRGLSDPKLDNWQLYTGQEALTNSQKADYDQNLRDVETARRRRS